MPAPHDAPSTTPGDMADPDAVLVVAALAHLRHLDDPERHLMRDTDRVPRTKSGWVRQVIRALRAGGVRVEPPRPAAPDREGDREPDHSGNCSEGRQAGR